MRRLSPVSAPARRPATHRRRRLLRLAATLGAALLGAACQGDAQPPNILLISLDTCRADHLSAYGYGRRTSPFLEQLAARGTLYTNAFVNTLGTPSSHATMLSSLYQESHRVDYRQPGAAAASLMVIPEQVELLPEILREHGYLTLAVTGGGWMSEKVGFARGFEVFERRHQLRPAMRLLARRLGVRAADERPRFVLFHTYQIHSDYAPPAPYREIFGSFDSDFEPTSANLKAVVRGERKLSPAELEHTIALYDAEIRFTDDVLAELFARLEALGFFDRYLVVVTSDHGEEFLDHGRVLHPGTLYDELLHVPLIVAGDRVPAGRVVDELVSSVDLAPTILAYAGLPIPPAMRGRPLLGAAAPGPAPELVFAQFGGRRFAARSRRWKYIDDRQLGRVELYDLEADPGEQRNVARLHPRVAADLRRRVERWRGAQNVATAAAEVSLDAAEEEQLRALGYLGDN